MKRCDVESLLILLWFVLGTVVCGLIGAFAAYISQEPRVPLA